MIALFSWWCAWPGFWWWSPWSWARAWGCSACSSWPPSSAASPPGIAASCPVTKKNTHTLSKHISVSASILCNQLNITKWVLQRGWQDLQATKWGAIIILNSLVSTDANCFHFWFCLFVCLFYKTQASFQWQFKEFSAHLQTNVIIVSHITSQHILWEWVMHFGSFIWDSNINIWGHGEEIGINTFFPLNCMRKKKSQKSLTKCDYFWSQKNKSTEVCPVWPIQCGKEQQILRLPSFQSPKCIMVIPMRNTTFLTEHIFPSLSRKPSKLLLLYLQTSVILKKCKHSCCVHKCCDNRPSTKMQTFLLRPQMLW